MDEVKYFYGILLYILFMHALATIAITEGKWQLVLPPSHSNMCCSLSLKYIQRLLYEYNNEYAAIKIYQHLNNIVDCHFPICLDY